MNKEKLNDIICQSSSDYEILNDAYNYIENLEQQCKKQKEVIDRAIKYINSSDISIDIRKTDESLDYVSTNELLNILKEVSE